MALTEQRPATAQADLEQRVGRWLIDAIPADNVQVKSIRSLSGGAIQENWLLHCAVTCDGNTSDRKLVMRNDATASIAESRSRQQEFELMSAAHNAGVLTPQPIGFCNDPSVTGKNFAMMAFVDGVGLGPKVVKDTSLGGDRQQLGHALAHQLGLIHAMQLQDTGITFIDTSRTDHAGEEINHIRHWLQEHRIFRPALAWGLRWAELHKPAESERVFLHRDFRTGNFLVDEHGLTAILDWEFAGYGDPMSDIGWFCAECWRFSRPDLEAGGITSRQQFYDSYTGASGREVDHSRVLYWEVIAHMRWAVIALQQGQRHLSGVEPSLSMAITSRIVDQLELIVLRMTAPDDWSRAMIIDEQQMTLRKLLRDNTAATNAALSTSTHQSMADDLIRIARDTLGSTVIAAVDRPARLPALMADNALGIAQRELELSPVHNRVVDQLLMAGNWTDQAALNTDIQDGKLDGNEVLHHALRDLCAVNSYIYRPASVSKEELALAGIK